MQLFYNPDLGPTSKEIIFDKDESRHIIRVLRKKEMYYTSPTEKVFYFLRKLYWGMIKNVLPQL